MRICYRGLGSRNSKGKQGLAYTKILHAESLALEDFLARWKAGTLPKPSWTHGAHVAVAAYLAFDHAPEEALDLTRAGIVHYNNCVGTPNTEDNGYHETLTRFWSSEIGNVVRRGGFASRLEAVRQVVRLFGADRDRHRLFYSFDVVADRRARREWVAPDRPRPGRQETRANFWAPQAARVPEA